METAGETAKGLGEGPNESTDGSAERTTASSLGYADIVMKGGVASGVVYPNAIFKISRRYDLKNIGGTSVGAIAASLAAAAEFRRRCGSDDGYAGLAKVPGFLVQEGTLRALFTADARAKPLLDIALCMTGGKSLWLEKLPAIAARLAAYFWWITLVALLSLGGAVWLIDTQVAGPQIVFFISATLSVILAWVVTVIVWISVRCVNVLDKGDFGWCHGHDQSAVERLAASLSREPDPTTLTAKETPPLIDWLEVLIGFLAGKKSDDPLTFGDLWNAPRPKWDSSGTVGGKRSIDFTMVTTCLTLGRPFSVPFDPSERVGRGDDSKTELDDDCNRRPPLYFRVDLLRRFFSTRIIEHLKTYGASMGEDNEYYRLPAAERMPIVVAARLSMSFPILFSAVPLFALGDNGRMQPVWFSDGGLSSNFPIYLFDSPLPRWPTFCIDLLGGKPNPRDRRHPHPFDKENVPSTPPFLEWDVPVGTVEAWNRLSRGFARGNVLAFASAMIDSMRTWQDASLGMLPGNSSRTVGIRLSPGEGGLNLTMPPSCVIDMTKRGGAAGQFLVERFDPKTNTGWGDQCWIRYRATMNAYNAWLEGYCRSYTGQLQAESGLRQEQAESDARQEQAAGASDQAEPVPAGYPWMVSHYYKNNATLRTKVGEDLLWPNSGIAKKALAATECLAKQRGRWHPVVVAAISTNPPEPISDLRLRPNF